ncbi:hypothetical protein ACFWVP_17505 [Streptomyces sp. NPDC058637]
MRLSDLQKALDFDDTSAFDIRALQGHPGRRRLRIGTAPCTPSGTGS